MLPSTHSRPIAVLAGSLAFGLAGGAHAEANPYYLGISETLGHSSNVFQVDNAVVPDKYSITSLLVGFDQPISRERLFANASVRATRYEDITVLNNVGYSLNAGLDWASVEQLSGGFGVSTNRTLANYAASGGQLATTNKNLETSGQVNARVQLGLVSLLALNATLAHSQLSYSAPEYASSEERQNSVGVGLTYRPSGLLTLGSEVRFTRGEYPNILLPNGDKETFDRKDLDLTGTWVATGLSTLNARLGYSRSTFDTLTQRDFSGVTGSLSWAWQPTGKLSINTTLSRDTGAESTFTNLANSLASNVANNQGYYAVGDTSVLTNAVALSAGYEATGKIRVNAGLRYARRKLLNEQFVGGVLVSSTEGRDSVTSVTLGATWDPTRNWQLGCNAGQDSGKPSDTASGVSTRYTNTIVTCTVQFTVK
jgi:hypothetical protein